MRRVVLAVALFCAGFWCIGQSSAYWQSRDSNYNKAITSGGGSITITPQTPPAVQSNPGLVTTFSANIGTASSGRIVVVDIIGTLANPYTFAVTEATNSMTCPAGARQQTTLDFNNTEIICYVVDSVNSGAQNIIITLLTGAITWNQVGIVVYSISGSSTPTPVLPASQDPYNYVSGNQTTATLTIPAGGGLIMAGYSESNNPGLSGNMTINNTINLSGTQNLYSASTTSTGSFTPTINSVGADGFGMVVAAWGP